MPILSCDLLAGVEGLHSAPFLLKLHVHLSDAVDGVGFLPDHLEVGLLLEPRSRVPRYQTVRVVLLAKLAIYGCVRRLLHVLCA